MKESTGSAMERTALKLGAAVLKLHRTAGYLEYRRTRLESTGLTIHERFSLNHLRSNFHNSISLAED
jgi:hypothetical protein